MPFSQRRHIERNHVQAVKQIFAEISARDFIFQILVGGGDNPDIHGNGFVSAHRLKSLLLERAQDFGLRLQAHVADFVQETAFRRRPSAACRSCPRSRR